MKNYGKKNFMDKRILRRFIFMEKSTVLSERKEIKLEWKKVLLFSLLIACVITPVFADGVTEVESAVQKVTDFLSSGVITAICLIALVVEGIGVVVMGKQGADIQAIISKFAPWIVGTVVLLSANGICTYFLSDLSFD